MTHSRPAKKYASLLAAAILPAAIGVATSASAQTRPSEDWTPPDGKTLATSQPATTEPAAKVIAPAINVAVTEWAVFVAEPFNGQLNRTALIANSFPPFIDDLRSTPSDAPTTDPMPVGVIRITPTGKIGPEDSIDVTVGYKGGRTLGTWPRANIRSSGILWQNLKLQTTPAATTLIPLPDDSWLKPLRTDGPLITSENQTEPFLLYDLELACRAELQLTSSKPNTYSVVQPMEAILHDVTFYRSDADGHWMSARIDTLKKTVGSTLIKHEAPRPQNENETPTNASGIALRLLKAAVGGGAATTSAPATTQPVGTPITLSPAAGTDDALFAPWKTTLTDAGVSTGDQSVILKILARYALDKKRLTAVYRMDPADLDKLLPLEVVPQPQKISRIALIILTGIDPAIDTEIDTLILKLGSKSWNEREDAMTALKKLGPVTRPHLEKAATNKDVEIAYRVEQLLQGPSK